MRRTENKYRVRQKRREREKKGEGEGEGRSEKKKEEFTERFGKILFFRHDGLMYVHTPRKYWDLQR